MSEEVSLAGRLRRMADDIEWGAQKNPALQLRQLAQEWERLEGVRERIGPVLQAVRGWTQAGADLGLRPGERDLLAAQEALEAEVAKVAAPTPAVPEWRPGTWADVISGDRVRLGTAEAVVENVIPLKWAGSKAEQVSVTLQGREKAYAMPPGGPVEILRGAPGQAVDEAGVEILASWGPDFVDAIGILREAFPGLEAVNDG